MSTDGDLEFSEELYSEAVYRGKVETYTRSANESIEKLKSSLEMLKTMGDKHLELEAKLAPSLVQSRVGIGEPINSEQRGLLQKLSPILLPDESVNEKI